MPSYYYCDLHQKLQTLTQGNYSVENYFKEMEITMMHMDVQEVRQVTIARFLNGLRLEIAELQYYIDNGDMVDKAVKVERCLKRTSST